MVFLVNRIVVQRLLLSGRKNTRMCRSMIQENEVHLQGSARFTNYLCSFLTKTRTVHSEKKNVK